MAQALEDGEKEQKEQWKQLGSQAHPGYLLLETIWDWVVVVGAGAGAGPQLC